jgi:hypothetical protein
MINVTGLRMKARLNSKKRIKGIKGLIAGKI